MGKRTTVFVESVVGGAGIHEGKVQSTEQDIQNRGRKILCSSTSFVPEAHDWRFVTTLLVENRPFEK